MKKYRDYFFKRAKRENYPARSVYKLKEMDRRFNIFSPSYRVLDLGASPGSWTLYARERIGRRGRILAIDLKGLKIPSYPEVVFYKGDIMVRDDKFNSLLEEHSPFDVIMSDMAPKTTGIKLRDQTLSLELAQMALEISLERLKDKGIFIVKIFNGPDVPAFLNKMRESFFRVRVFKPKSSRSESKETFLLGFKLKNQC